VFYLMRVDWRWCSSQSVICPVLKWCRCATMMHTCRHTCRHTSW